MLIKKAEQMLDFFLGWQERTAVEPNDTHILSELHQVLRKYNAYASRLDRFKQTLKGLVKPGSITKFTYIDIE